MNEIKLGKLIDGPAERDAIHIAIAPVVANERLKPGIIQGPLRGIRAILAAL